MEAAQVKRTVRQYLVELEEQNPVEEPVHQQEQVSTTDPDSTYATKGGTPARLGYYDNYLVDNHSCVIVGVQATAARMSQETVAAQDMLTRFARWQGREPVSVAADTTYGNGEFLHWLAEREIIPYMRTPGQRPQKEEPLLRPRTFYLSAGKQQLSLSCRAATQLRRAECPEPHLCLHRDPQTLWCVFPESAMHQWSLPVSCYPHAGAGSATHSRPGRDARLRPCAATTFWAVAARKNRSRTNFILRKRRRRSPIWFLSSANNASTFFRHVHSQQSGGRL